MIGIIMFFAALLLLLFGFPGGVHLRWRGPVLWRRGGRFAPVRLHALPHHEHHAEHHAHGHSAVHLHGHGAAEDPSWQSSCWNPWAGFRRSPRRARHFHHSGGALLAASTGVVGASVVAMGVISLPVMLKYDYDKGLATGTICASGTLGQIIPPSIILIILGDVLGIPVGDLFRAAVMAGAGAGRLVYGLHPDLDPPEQELAPPMSATAHHHRTTVPEGPAWPSSRRWR